MLREVADAQLGRPRFVAAHRFQPLRDQFRECRFPLTVGAEKGDGFTLLDMEDLTAFAEAGRAERRNEIAAVRTVIDDEVARFKAAVAGRQVEPLVSAFRRQVEDLRQAEVARLGADDASRAQVDAATRSIMNKLLHGPMAELRDAAGTPRGERLADALRELFDVELDD